MAKANKSSENETELLVDRRNSDERRVEDRRQQSEEVAVERRVSERRTVQRRRQIDPTTCERDYTADEIEFMRALDEYKRANGRMFPTCSEILEVVRDLGYVRTLEPVDAVEDEPSLEDSQTDEAAESTDQELQTTAPDFFTSDDEDQL